MMRSKSLPICNRSHARRADSAKIKILGGGDGVPVLDALVRGESLDSVHEICSQETRDSALSYGENPESPSQLGLNRYRVVTDRQTDRLNYDS